MLEGVPRGACRIRQEEMGAKGGSRKGAKAQSTAKGILEGEDFGRSPPWGRAAPARMKMGAKGGSRKGAKAQSTAKGILEGEDVGGSPRGGMPHPLGGNGCEGGLSQRR